MSVPFARSIPQVRANVRAGSIGTRLVLLVLSVLVPMVILSLAAHAYVYRSERQGLERTLRETVRALALVVDREMARREAILNTLTASAALDRNDLEALQTQALRVLGPGETLVLTDLNGRELFETPSPLPDAVPETVFTPEQRQRVGPEGTIITPVFETSAGGPLRYAIQRPIIRDGKVAGYLAVASTIQHFQHVLDDQELPEAWTGAIIEPSGRIMARSISPERHVGGLANPDVRARAAEATSGFFESTTRDGVETFAFFDRAPLSNWIVILGVPKAEVGRVTAGAMMVVSSGSLILLAAAFVLAVRVGRSIVEPVRRLEEAATDLGRGRSVQPQSLGLNEVDTVQRALADASRQIRQVNDQMKQRIAAAVEEAERTQQALQQAQKLEALGRLTGGIAHDFNNLLQTLRTGLQFAETTVADDDTRQALASCLRAVTRAAKLTRQLMAFGRHETSAARAVDLRNQILTMEDLFRSALRRDLVVRFDVPPDLWRVRVDPVLFEMAVLNLVFNARDAIETKGEINIIAGNARLSSRAIAGLPAGDYVKLAVRDNGAGMSSEVKAKALEPFFTTKPAGQGSGLGLAQVYGFVQQSDGAVTIDSEPGQGTTVTLYLPRTVELPEPEETERVDPAGRTGERLKVLVVEDDGLVRDVLGPALAGFDFAVTVVHDGREALATIEARPDLDVVFTDIVMPGDLNGVELAEIIRTRWPQLPVVLATGYAERGDSTGRWRTLTKPYEVAVVARELRAAVKRR